jgi:hypothetical protein
MKTDTSQLLFKKNSIIELTNIQLLNINGGTAGTLSEEIYKGTNTKQTSTVTCTTRTTTAN